MRRRLSEVEDGSKGKGNELACKGGACKKGRKCFSEPLDKDTKGKEGIVVRPKNYRLRKSVHRERIVVIREERGGWQRQQRWLKTD